MKYVALNRNQSSLVPKPKAVTSGFRHVGPGGLRRSVDKATWGDSICATFAVCKPAYSGRRCLAVRLGRTLILSEFVVNREKTYSFSDVKTAAVMNKNLANQGSLSMRRKVMRSLMRSILAKTNLRAARRWTKVLAVIGAIGFSAAASAAGSASGATITSVAIDSQIGGVAFITINVTKSNNPTCAGTSWAFVLPITTAVGNQMLAQLLAARAAGFSTVSLIGNGLCDTYSGVETLVEIIS
jgi:hypothetical protein